MNWTLALPEIVLACLGMAILVFGVLWKQESTRQATMLTIGAFAVAAMLAVTRQTGFGFNGQFVADSFATFNKMLILLGGVLALMLSLDWNKSQGIARFEYPVLVLFATVGMMIMVSASNLMTLYVGLELQSLALYVLAAFDRDNVRSSEAGLKYFVLSGLASGLLLYGVSLVYGFSTAVRTRNALRLCEHRLSDSGARDREADRRTIRGLRTKPSRARRDYPHEDQRRFNSSATSWGSCVLRLPYQSFRSSRHQLWTRTAFRSRLTGIRLFDCAVRCRRWLGGFPH